MYQFDEECINVFLKNQKQLFDEPVAQSREEAEEFLEDCMACVLDSIQDVKDYLEENGMDIEGMTLHDIEEASEVFSLPSGRYLIVEA